MTSVDWASLRTLIGGADFVPHAIERLLGAVTPEAADAAYWELDNRVVAQGQLFNSAELVAQEIVHRICEGAYSPMGLPGALNLLVEIAYGEPDASELALGENQLAERCREKIFLGLECIKGLASCTSEEILIAILDLIDRLDLNASTRAAFLETLPRPGWPKSAIGRLEELQS